MAINGQNIYLSYLNEKKNPFKKKDIGCHCKSRLKGAKKADKEWEMELIYDIYLASKLLHIKPM